MHFSALATLALAIGLTSAIPTINIAGDLIPNSSKLANATITFHTEREKNVSSLVTISVKDGDKVIVGKTKADFGHFGNKTDNGPFQLDYIHSATRDEVKAANVSITLDSVGKDDWKFDWAITFTFEDGPKIVTKEDGVELSAPQEVLTWPVIST